MKLTDEMKKKIIIVEIIIIIILIGIISILLLIKEEKNEEEISMSEISSLVTSTTTISEEFYVDIKGAVKKPGVYLVKKGSIINDVIKLAGGLSKNAYTKNINLSQITHDSMVIYIFTTSEIKKGTTTIITDTTCKAEVIEINNCIEETTTTKKDELQTDVNKLVNINTATIEELTTISGIGTSKAEAIISYRKEKTFEKIEDIMNVSGIGESVFAKIKDSITV